MRPGARYSRFSSAAFGFRTRVHRWSDSPVFRAARHPCCTRRTAYRRCAATRAPRRPGPPRAGIARGRRRRPRSLRRDTAPRGCAPASPPGTRPRGIRRSPAAHLRRRRSGRTATVGPAPYYHRLEPEQPFPQVAGEFGSGREHPAVPVDEGEPLVARCSRVTKCTRPDATGPARSCGGCRSSSPQPRRRREAVPVVNRGLGDGEDRDRHTERIRGAQFGLEHRPGDAMAAVGRRDGHGADRPRVHAGMARYGERRCPSGARRDRGDRVGAGIIPHPGGAPRGTRAQLGVERILRRMPLVESAGHRREPRRERCGILRVDEGEAQPTAGQPFRGLGIDRVGSVVAAHRIRLVPAGGWGVAPA